MTDNYSKEFNLRDGLIYLNHAGVSPWPLRTVNAVKGFAEENGYEGSFNYLKWMDDETLLRNQARDLINARSADDIALLKNTSEALSVVAYGIDWSCGDNVISTNLEFPSNRIVWESLALKGVEFREAPVDQSGDPEGAILALVDKQTRVISVSSTQYSTGLRLDLERIGAFCRERDIFFCVDAIQSIGAVRFDVQKFRADFVMADAHKWMMGPEGIALFYSRPEARDKLKLHEFGWHMIEAAGDFDTREWSPALSAKRFECGSPNMTGIHALSASLSLLLEAGMDSIESAVLERTSYIIDKINRHRHMELLTPAARDRHAGIVTFACTGQDNTALYQHLMENQVLCANRSGGIRFSPHFYTPFEVMDRAFAIVGDYIEGR